MFDICYGLTFNPNYIGTAMNKEKQAEVLNPKPIEPMIVAKA